MVRGIGNYGNLSKTFFILTYWGSFYPKEFGFSGKKNIDLLVTFFNRNLLNKSLAINFQDFILGTSFVPQLKPHTDLSIKRFTQ
jgi:hypothetical protein